MLTGRGYLMRKNPAGVVGRIVLGLRSLVSVCHGPAGSSALCNPPDPLHIRTFKPAPLALIARPGSNGKANGARDPAETPRSRMSTLALVAPSITPPFGLLSVTRNRFVPLATALRRSGTLMVFTVAFSGNARVPETA